MQITTPRDVKPKHLSGGQWKVSKLRKGQRASRTTSRLGTSYIAVPPPEGWPGGDPIRNGYKP